jgi:hypothetical protein
MMCRPQKSGHSKTNPNDESDGRGDDDSHDDDDSRGEDDDHDDDDSRGYDGDNNGSSGTEEANKSTENANEEEGHYDGENSGDWLDSRSEFLIAAIVAGLFHLMFNGNPVSRKKALSLNHELSRVVRHAVIESLKKTVGT